MHTGILLQITGKVTEAINDTSLAVDQIVNDQTGEIKIINLGNGTKRRMDNARFSNIFQLLRFTFFIESFSYNK